MIMDKETKNRMMLRRGELMAELLLRGFDPLYLARPDADIIANIEYDYLVGFTNPRGGLNTYGVEVKSTDDPVKGKYQLNNGLFEKLAFANTPSLLLVIDVKQDQLFYSWLTDGDVNGAGHEAKMRDVPVVYLDEDEKVRLRPQMVSGVV